MRIPIAIALIAASAAPASAYVVHHPYAAAHYTYHGGVAHPHAAYRVARGVAVGASPSYGTGYTNADDYAASPSTGYTNAGYYAAEPSTSYTNAGYYAAEPSTSYTNAGHYVASPSTGYANAGYHVALPGYGYYGLDR